MKTLLAVLLLSGNVWAGQYEVVTDSSTIEISTGTYNLIHMPACIEKGCNE